MATNLQLDDKLIDKAVRLGKHRTKKDAVTRALQDYVSYLQQVKSISQFGTIEFDPAYDYKKQRARG